MNLLAHQDYSDPHRVAKILWYADRVIFENPGNSFVPLREMLEGGATESRNPLLARLFRQAAEQAGTGIPTIVTQWRTSHRQAPEIANDPGRKLYRLTLVWLPQEGAERQAEPTGTQPERVFTNSAPVNAHSESVSEPVNARSTPMVVPRGSPTAARVEREQLAQALLAHIQAHPGERTQNWQLLLAGLQER